MDAKREPEPFDFLPFIVIAVHIAVVMVAFAAFMSCVERLAPFDQKVPYLAPFLTPFVDAFKTPVWEVRISDEAMERFTTGAFYFALFFAVLGVVLAYGKRHSKPSVHRSAEAKVS